MPYVLKDKIALVTGGGQGLGQAVCQRLAQAGARVVVTDISGVTATTTATEIASLTGQQTLGLAGDVTDEAQVEAMVAQTVAHFGRLDIVVANAGIVIASSVTEFPAEQWRQVIEVNLIGYYLTAKHAARVMIEQRSGSIIQMNSKSGKKGSYKNSAYAASKFGGIGLTQSLALELADYGIRVNAVCPGNLLDSPLWVDSLYQQYGQRFGLTEAQVRQKYIDQVPLKRGCTYDDVCNVVIFLASDQAGYMTGQAVNVTGGQEMR
ncbi:MAG: sorbitol-6-phosphate dehydrogenase [Anaerolineaceae bacterium]|nr:sorbitol-6-phosphate dehydrogenase [Anaerolineaceae bacterium]MCB9099010.1 sorbitol-6-phosphate dehydrogenase [Anaerolineales bacterium]